MSDGTSVLKINLGICLSILFFAAVLCPTPSFGQANLFKAVKTGGGFTSSMRSDWRATQGSMNGLADIQQAAYAWCKTTSHYVNTSSDCTAHAGSVDTVTYVDGGIPTSRYYVAVVNLYRSNGAHGNLQARWYPYQNTDPCSGGQLVSFKKYECVDEEYQAADPPQPMVCTASNPCNPVDGNKLQVEVDYRAPGNSGIDFVRYYNSTGTYRTAVGMGTGWRHTYSRYLNEGPSVVPFKILAARDGESAVYSTASDACTDGWDDIKTVAFKGELTGATVSFQGGNTCEIQSGGATVGYLPLRHRHGSFWEFNASTTTKTLTRPNGTQQYFKYDGTDWINELDPSVTLVASGSDWIYTDKNDTEEKYNSSGQLVSITLRNGQTTNLYYHLTGSNGDGDPETLDRVTGPFGHKLEFEYRSGLLDEVNFPGGDLEYSYDYDERAIPNLDNVRFNTGSVRYYIYDDPDLPHHLTGITDENGDRYATWEYDDAGRATLSKHGTNKEIVEFTYNSNGTTTVDLGNGQSSTYAFELAQGKTKLDSRDASDCSRCPMNDIESRDYDANGFIDETIDWNGNVTSMIRNSRGLIETLVEADGALAERTKTTTWHTTYRLPTEVSTSINDTIFTHDLDGNVEEIEVTDGALSRKWTMTFDSTGKVLTVDGPRTDVSDVTTYVYNNCTYGGQCGNVKTITNALGHVLDFNSYQSDGRLKVFYDANDQKFEFWYNGNGKVTTINVTPTVGTIRETSFTYTNADQLKTVTYPTGQKLTYEYSDAHYLEKVTDNFGNYIDYDYDAMGNLSDEDFYDDTNTLQTTKDYAYDLNENLETVTSGGIDTDLVVDEVGNMTSTTDPSLATTSYDYDALNRLVESLDALSGYTDLVYDAHDNLKSVSAPNNAVTDFDYDGLDNLIEEDSPDRGLTSYTHDAAGNIITKTDARNKTTSYTYDALNRLTEIEYDNLDTIVYQYDVGTNALGRLNKVTDNSGETTWTYNNFGEITAKTQKIGLISLTTSYDYDPLGRMEKITYPSGKEVNYGYDDERVISVAVELTDILTGADYDPFGPVNAWTWGNTTTHSRSYDSRGLLTSQSLVTDTRTLGYEASGRIETLDDARHDLGFDYNVLGQLTHFTALGSAPLIDQDFTYDENGNRESIVENSTTYNYVVTNNTNRLASTAGPVAKTYSYDLAGNISGDGIHTYAYNDIGRLVGVDSNAVAYEHNGQGQRVKKDDGTDETLFVYNEYGQLIGEYDDTGTAILEHVWFAGAPVAVIDGSSNYYVHTDHLGTPRVVSDGNTAIWRWESDPFGSIAADDDPDADTVSFTYNLRFPGQYLDSETGLHYNYFRIYDPSTGRYLESDPIGLEGGLNTYGYVGASPLQYIDMYGLEFGHVSSTFADEMATIRSQEVGRRLLDSIEDSNLITNVWDGANHCENKTVPFFDKDGNLAGYNVFVYPGEHDHLKLAGRKDGKYQPFTPSTTRVLAHELGHATGIGDTGGSLWDSIKTFLGFQPNKTRMDNINKWENPIMTPIDGFERTGYSGSIHNECQCGVL